LIKANPKAEKKHTISSLKLKFMDNLVQEKEEATPTTEAFKSI